MAGRGHSTLPDRRVLPGSVSLGPCGLPAQPPCHHCRVGQISLGAALLAIAFTPSLFWIRAELLVLGMGAGLYLPSGVAVLTENTREGSWGTALAIHELGPNLGYICAPLLAEFLLRFFAWQGVLGAIGAPAIVLSGVFLMSGLGGSSARIGRVRRSSHGSSGIGRSGVASLFAVSIGLGLGLYTMMPLFLVSDVGMERLPANLITGLSRISGLFSVFLAGALADRIGRPRTVLFSLAAAGICAVVLGLVRGTWFTPVLIFLQSAFAASFYPAGFSLLSSVFPLPIRNVAVSMVLMFATLVGAGAVPPLSVSWQTRSRSRSHSAQPAPRRSPSWCSSVASRRAASRRRMATRGTRAASR